MNLGNPIALAILGIVAVVAGVLFARHFTKRDTDTRLARMTPVATLGEDQARLVLVALPAIAAAAVIVATRAGEYGPWAHVAALPLALASFAGWRLPVGPTPAGYARWGRLALGCAFAALAAIVAALRIASPD